MRPSITKPVLGHFLVALLGALLLLVNPLTAIATNYNRDIAVAGTAIYASLRGISSVMSVVQDTDLQVSVPLFSVASSPGQVLQPVIGTIERMSNVLFALVVSSGVLSFTLPVVSGIGSALLLAFGTIRGALRFLAVPVPGSIERAMRGCISLGVLAALGVPLAYSVAFVIGDRFTSDAWADAQSVFEKQAEILSSADVSGIDIPETQEQAATDDSTATGGGNAFDWAKSAIGGAVQGSTEAIQGALSATAGFAAELRTQLAAGTGVVENGMDAASELFEASVKIGVAYFVKLFVLPFLLLLGFLWVIRSIGHGEITMPTRIYSDRGSD